MKEQEPLGLTTKVDNPTLEVRRDILMPEPGNGEVQPKETPYDNKNETQPQEPAVTMRDSLEKRQEAIRAHFDRENQGRTVRFEERQTQRLMIEHGVLPQRGGSGDEPKDQERQSPAKQIKPSTEGEGDGGKPPERPAPPTGPTPEQPEEQEPSEKKPATPEEIVASFKREAERKKAGLTEEEQENLKRDIEQAKAAGIPPEDTDILEYQLVDAITRMRGRQRAESQEGFHLPESLEDLAVLIMNSEGEDWKEGGKKALMKDGKVVKEHFLAWVRKRARQIDEFNPYTNINLFSDINVKFGYSVISFYEMIFTGSYFLEKRKEEDGTSSFHKNKDYEKLKDELIKEVFLYNTDKNSFVTYKSKMHSEEELPGVVMGLYYGNPNFRGNYLEQIMTLSSTNEHEIGKVKDKAGKSYEGHEIDKLLEGNNTLGEGIRRAFLTYFHISDYEMLKKMHGEDSVLFKEKYRKIDPDTGEIEIKDGKQEEDIGGVVNEEHKKRKEQGDKKVKVIKYKDGKLDTSHGENVKTFIDHINIFNNANKDARSVVEVRERIRQYLMDSLGLDYEEAGFAEGWAYNKTLPMGVGARNDLNASGFDAYSKQMNLLPYRLKQFEPKRKGQIGNIFDVGVIKRTSLTPLEEITDSHRRTVIEAIQGGQGSEYSQHNPFDKEKEGYESLEFGQDEGQRWSAMAFANGDVIRKLLMDGTGFDIDNLLSYDQFGRPIIDQKRADEFLERVQKAMRYKWCTWDRTDFSKTVRVWDWKKEPDLDKNGRQKTDRNGKPAEKTEIVFRDVPTIAAYFGPEVIGFIKSDIERVKNRTGKTDKDLRGGRESNVWDIDGIGGDNKIDVSEIQNSDIRDYLWKHVEKVLVAKSLEAHRNVFSELQRHGYAMVEKFFDFFRAKDIWDKEDEKEVRNLSKTSEARLLAEEIPTSILLGILSGAWKEIKRAAPRIEKDI